MVAAARRKAQGLGGGTGGLPACLAHKMTLPCGLLAAGLAAAGVPHDPAPTDFVPECKCECQSQGLCLAVAAFASSSSNTMGGPGWGGTGFKGHASGARTAGAAVDLVRLHLVLQTTC